MSFKIRWVFLMCVMVSIVKSQTTIDPDLLADVFGPLENIAVEPTLAPKTIEEEDGSSCICVPYWLCDPKTNETTSDGKFDGFGKLDIRFKPESCQVSVEKCCKSPREPDNPVEVVEHPERLNGCGIRNEKGIDFQITTAAGSDAAEFGEFPWTVAILTLSNGTAICGGSLIHPQVVLTGAHCVGKLRAEDIKVRAGEWDTQTTQERLPFKEQNVERIAVHSQFNTQNLANDVALMFLKAPIELADNINTICLPPEGTTFENAKSCFGTGWGKTNFGKTGRYAVIMKKIELDTVNHATCQRQFQKTRLGGKFKLHSTFLCAGGTKGKDTCKGDGGAPLVCPSPTPGRYYQAGIVAWGIGCGEQDVPAAYGHVSKFRSWVDKKMQEANLDTSSYILV